MNINEQVFSTLSGGAPLGSTPTIVRQVGTDPAANTEASLTVPAGEAWELKVVTFQIIQGATQTPLPTLLIKDASGNTVYAGAGASSAQNASVTCDYYFAPGLVLTAGAANTRAYAPLPSGLLLPAGWVLETSTAGKGANTDIEAISAWTVEYA
jgi:uncharacterized protein YfaQ (DUF2300 family)